MRRLVMILPLLFAAGCVGDLNELGPGRDGGASVPDLTMSTGGQDLAGANPGNDGGVSQSYKFSPDIETDIENLGCTASACHGGTQIPVLKNGAVAQNYANFKTEAMLGENSPVLLKNLAGSGVTHGGGSKFLTKSDPVYVRWLAWINAGEPQ